MLKGVRLRRRPDRSGVSQSERQDANKRRQPTLLHARLLRNGCDCRKSLF
jgi:hypothetical protein